MFTLALLGVEGVCLYCGAEGDYYMHQDDGPEGPQALVASGPDV